MTAAKSPQPGDIWREVDPRRERFIYVSAVAGGWATIHTTEKIGLVWERKRGSTNRHADVTRFNGKRGGYAFHESIF